MSTEITFKKDSISGPEPCVRDYSRGLLTAAGPQIDPWLTSIDKLLPRGDGRYWYLAGPMTGRDGYNYAEFHRIAEVLRGQAYSLVSPHEFEHESHRARIAASDGEEDVGAPWHDCLARDVVVVANPRCVGVILIEGWHESKGALLETQVADSLGKPLLEFSEDPLCLRQIDREEALTDYGRVKLAEVIQNHTRAIQEAAPLPAGFRRDHDFLGERIK